MYRLFFN